jgi:hypothetical protein
VWDLHDPSRWGLSAEATSTVGERLYEFWLRFRACFKTRTRDTSANAYNSLRGQLTMDNERNVANMARNMVVYLSPADKSHRLTRRLSQEQKGL